MAEFIMLGTYPLRAALDEGNPGWVFLASSQRGWGLHTVRGGIDPGDHSFLPGLLEL